MLQGQKLLSKAALWHHQWCTACKLPSMRGLPQSETQARVQLSQVLSWRSSGVKDRSTATAQSCRCKTTTTQAELPQLSGPGLKKPPPATKIKQRSLLQPPRSWIDVPFTPPESLYVYTINKSQVSKRRFYVQAFYNIFSLF
jgi:hypothetical protein